MHYVNYNDDDIRVIPNTSFKLALSYALKKADEANQMVRQSQK